MRWPITILGVLAISLPAAPVAALDVSGGLAGGGVLVGTVPIWAINAEARGAWPLDAGWFAGGRLGVTLLPAFNSLGLGLQARSSGNVGYAGKSVDMDVGPSLVGYSMPACGQTHCGRIVGIAPGVQLRVAWYLWPRVGISANLNADWIHGRSTVLGDTWSLTFLAGFVLRGGQ